MNSFHHGSPLTKFSINAKNLLHIFMLWKCFACQQLWVFPKWVGWNSLGRGMLTPLTNILGGDVGHAWYMLTYLWLGGVRPCATTLLSKASSINCLCKLVSLPFNRFSVSFEECDRISAPTSVVGHGSVFAGSPQQRWQRVQGIWERRRSSWEG